MDILYGQRSTHPKKENQVTNWVIVDAKDQVLGRLVSQVAMRIMGKHRPDYQPGVLMGDHVVVINAAQVKVTGDKLNQKEYKWHSGFVGGLKRRLLKDQFEKQPEEVIIHALRGMLPKSKFGKKLRTRVRVFAGADHDLQAQKPTELKLSI